MTAPVLWRRLFDDAAVFPPGNAPFATAVPAHDRRRRTVLGDYVGPFIAPVARWDEFVAVLPPGPVEVSAIVTVPALAGLLEAVAAEPRVALRGVEVATAGASGVPETVDALGRLLPDGVTAYLEVPVGPGFAAAADVVAAAGLRIKVRTGGTTAEAFPSPIGLSHALATCVRLGLPFKLTAGLHHAVRHTDPATGFEHHGFVNVVAAVAGALSGGPNPEGMAEILGQTDAAALGAYVGGLTAGNAGRVRELFTSFGTCSVDEPYEDLMSLGLVPGEAEEEQ